MGKSVIAACIQLLRDWWIHDRHIMVLRVVMRLEGYDQCTRRIDGRNSKAPDQESHKK
jgi:hypothetical protein